MMHTVRNNFTCNDCNKSFRDKYNFKFHLEAHSKEKLNRFDNKKFFTCEICKKVSPLNSKFMVALATGVDGEKTYACHVCIGSFACRQYLKNFVKKEHSIRSCNTLSSEESFKCETCLKNFSNCSELQSHLSVHLDEKFTCFKCSESFMLKKNLKLHMRKYHSDTKKLAHRIRKLLSTKKYSCEICQEIFQTGTKLRSHKITHKYEKHYACNECDKRFKTKFFLTNHIRKHHTVQEPLKCEICHKSFDTLFKLKRHIRSHTGEKPYACDLCDKRYASKSYLEFHIRTAHSQEEVDNYALNSNRMLFKCSVCQKCFPCNNSLKRHEVTHTGIKSFSCLECDKSYSWKSLLTQHVKKVHSKKDINRPLIKPFKCDICSKAFSYKYLRNRHLKVHTGVKPYACGQCDCKYTRSYDLKLHIKKIHCSSEADDTDLPIY